MLGAFIVFSVSSIVTPMIDKELLTFIESLNGMKMHISEASLPKYRKMLSRNPSTEVIDGVEVYRQTISHAGSEARVKVYKPAKAKALSPALLWMHGGGYIMGSVDNDPIAVEIARTMELVIVSVDYRLAPEHPFPAAHDDCYAAFHWLVEQADNLGIDVDKIALGGDSAGAGLAACLVQRIMHEQGPAICFQFLLYPMLDNQHDTVSGRIDEYPVWNRQTSLNAWQMFLKGYKKGDMPDYAVANTADNLTGLPATFITVGQMDLFRDECIGYAQKLMQAQVPAELVVIPGMVHGGQFLVPAARVSRRMISTYMNALQDGLS